MTIPTTFTAFSKIRAEFGNVVVKPSFEDGLPGTWYGTRGNSFGIPGVVAVSGKLRPLIICALINSGVFRHLDKYWSQPRE